MRKLVSVRQVNHIAPIQDADRIEKIIVDGWVVVAQKGLYNVGDNILYFEIDAFLPAMDERYQTYQEFGQKRFNDVLGHVVKTKKIKGVYSQGVIMPLSLFPEIVEPEFDVDYSELLGIKKFELPEPIRFAAKQQGAFPAFLQKSDQERIQNVYVPLKQAVGDRLFVGTYKVDGSSITVYSHLGKVGYCSRNFELKIEDTNNLYYKGAFNSGLFSAVERLENMLGRPVAIQGELVGGGIQNNFEGILEPKVFAYAIYDVNEQRFMPFEMFYFYCHMLDIEMAPIVYKATKILQKPIDEILAMSDGKNMLGEKHREGIVWKELGGYTTFKAVSNIYLAKEK